MNTAGYSLPYPNSSNNASLFPPLVDNNSLSSASPPSNDQQSREEGEGGLLWNNVNTFAIPDDTILNPPPVQNSGFAKELLSKVNSNSTTSLYQDNLVDTKKDDGTVFHISWGGDDKPPVELHPQDEPIKLTRPLPKPRGIRKLPEPEPSEDGTIDEDTLKRRKVIYISKD
ncbi:hypothetical protein EDC96DRAFT_532936 [Choanephora cucurbitarum]|nr:hypothetical protein EDC96DRAFT_532936 [Choanephora cucurbitarum]